MIHFNAKQTLKRVHRLISGYAHNEKLQWAYSGLIKRGGLGRAKGYARSESKLVACGKGKLAYRLNQGPRE